MEEHICRYSKSMNQEFPRKCVICGKPEIPIQSVKDKLQLFIQFYTILLKMYKLPMNMILKYT